MDDLQKRIRAYYTANPGEELSRADMAIKFNAPRQEIDETVTRLIRNGFLMRADTYILRSKHPDQDHGCYVLDLMP